MQQKLLMLPALTIAVAALAGGFSGEQESAAVTRLQQEVAQLRFELDTKSSRLEREVQQLRSQLSELRYAPESLATRSPPSITPPASADEMQLRRLVILDGQSRPRLVLAVGDRYGPMVGLLNSVGDVVALLSAPDGDPRLELFDSGGELRASLPEQR